MPTILRVDGLRVVVYPNDHPPAHVHAIGPGWVVVVDLVELEVREVIRCSPVEARRVLRLVGDHRAAFLDAWRRYHG